jgi:SAM-dependent methyltransferase
MRWYETAFDLDYLARYPHRNDAEAERDVEALLRLLRLDPDKPLLDLCCGAGRHLLALRRAGLRNLTGLDLSAPLLDEARRRFAEANLGPIELIQGDMREIPFSERFTTILSLFTSFGYFHEDAENARVLHSARSALRPGGRLLLDLMNPSWVVAHLVPEEETTMDGATVHVRRSVDAETQRVEKELVYSSSDGPARCICESVRLYAPNEVEHLLRVSGFNEVRFYGSLTGEAWTTDSRRMVVVATRPDEANP